MIKFGYQPRTNGPLATPQRLRHYAIEAERLGFDAISVTDHLIHPTEVESRYPYNKSGAMTLGDADDMYDVMSILGLWVGITERITLQTSVLVLPYRNPVLTAKTLACLDVLSGGRLEVGVGIGWLKEEFDILAAPDFADRGKIADEYIQVYRTLWNDALPRFDGQFYQIDNLTMFPKPVRKPFMPILVGGTSKPALRRAGRLGDGWQALRVSPDDIRDGIAVIEAEAASIGRNLASDYEISLRFGMRITERATQRRQGEEGARVFVGTPDEVTAQIQGFIDAGVTAIMLDTRFSGSDEIDETLALFAEQVLPRFR